MPDQGKDGLDAFRLATKSEVKAEEAKSRVEGLAEDLAEIAVRTKTTERRVEEHHRALFGDHRPGRVHRGLVERFSDVEDLISKAKVALRAVLLFLVAILGTGLTALYQAWRMLGGGG